MESFDRERIEVRPEHLHNVVDLCTETLTILSMIRDGIQLYQPLEEIRHYAEHYGYTDVYVMELMEEAIRERRLELARMSN